MVVKVDGNEVNTAKMGDLVVVSITPNEGYDVTNVVYYTQFISESIDLEPDLVNEGQYSFVMPAHSVDITAYYERKTYNIVKMGMTNGDIEVLAQAQYLSSVTVTPVPTAGYKVSEMRYYVSDLDEGTIIPCNSNVYRFSMPAANVRIGATFEKETYIVTYYGPTGNGQIGVVYQESILYQDDAVYAGQPEKAQDNTYTYTFAGWVDNNEQPAVRTNISSNMNLYASYTPVYREYTITFLNYNGSLVASATYHYGQTVTLPANPTREPTTEHAYTFAGWSPEVVIAVAGNATYTATYTEGARQYAVYFGTGVIVTVGGQSIYPYPIGDKLDYGEEITVSYTLNEHYHLVSFTVNGEDAVNGGTYVVDMDMNIVFTQAIDTFTVSFYSERNTSDPNNNPTLLYTASDVSYGGSAFYVGENPTKVEDAYCIYMFAGWVNSNNTYVSSQADENQIDNVTSDMTVYATFVPIQKYSISIVGGDDTNVTIMRGSDTLTSSDTIYNSDILTITAVEKEGYTTEVSIEGVVAVDGQPNKYRVTGNVVITYTETPN